MQVPIMASTTKDKEGTRTRILNAALNEFSTKGLDGANIEHIARDAHVSKQLIYHYFRSKDELYKMTLESVAGGMRLLSQSRDSSAPTALEAFKLIVNFIIDEYINNPSYAKLTLDQGLHDGEHLDQYSGYVQNVNHYITKVLRPIIERGELSGELRKGLDAASVYWLILYSAAGCFLNTKLMSQTIGVDFSKEEGIKQWRDTATDFVVHAMCNDFPIPSFNAAPAAAQKAAPRAG